MSKEWEIKQKTHEYEAGRILGPDGKLLSIVQGKTEYREVVEKPEPPAGGKYL